ARERHPGERDARGEEVDERVPLDRRDDPDDESDAYREEQRRETELGGRRDPLGDRLEDALVRLERATEIALRELRDPHHVLHRQGLVEAHLLRSEERRVGKEGRSWWVV